MKKELNWIFTKEIIVLTASLSWFIFSDIFILIFIKLYEKIFIIKLGRLSFVKNHFISIYFSLTVISYSSIVPNVFPLGFSRGSIAIRYVSYYFQNHCVLARLRYENRVEKYLVWWKQKAYPIWKLERSHINPV